MSSGEVRVKSIAKCLSGVSDDVKGSCFARVDEEGAKGVEREAGEGVRRDARASHRSKTLKVDTDPARHALTALE